METEQIKKLYETNSFSIENTSKILKEIEELLPNSSSHKKTLHSFLQYSRKSEFLTALETDKNRNKWAELSFRIIREINFNFLELYEQRLEEYSQKALFLEKTNIDFRKWTYQQVYAHAKEIATFFYKQKPENPKVLIFMQNSIESATIDLACLMFDIFDSPINIHFNVENLSYILSLIDFDFIVTDNEQRYKSLKEAFKILKKEIKIVTTNKSLFDSTDIDYYLPKESKKFTKEKIDIILSQRKKKPINQVATTMFTSGSTGIPKGVSFSIYNIVSKRFARAAALPQVGKNEVFVCYLPFFHTFGRYLELTGTIFWGGTYVMANNPSLDSLTKIFQHVNPTGFISVPVRWTQFYEKINQEFDGTETDNQIRQKVRKTVGTNLHWGLSAAGYLEPKIFKFFHKNGISLNSGFGMTEATGGITMTSSFEYSENSVGKVLPGMQTRLNDKKELELKGHYLARYLENAGPEAFIPFPEEDDYWLKTGDIFIIHENGQHQIIDRVKDIYKNNKGQTISPRTTESKFDGVPGIKHTFLVGDGRPFNVLLIVPDEEDPIFKSFTIEQNKHEYFRQIIVTANSNLAPYERVVNFALTERDFTKENNEITAKGSFKRKNIEKNFAEIIKNLYKSNYINFDVDGYKIVIPRWLIRDLGILETDFVFKDHEIINKANNKRLRVEKCDKKDFFVIGDKAYSFTGKKIDIGRIILQPRLWVANPQLTEFAPCKANYDIPLKNFSSQICLPERRRLYSPANIKNVSGINDVDLIFLDNLLSVILHSDSKTAIHHLKELEKMISGYDQNKRIIIIRRLEALACHPEEKIRAYAYQLLVTMTPDIDYSMILPSFIKSGKTFLTEESIKKIAHSNINLRQLQALRRRMLSYRRGLKWPADEITHIQFEKIFELLLNFGKNNPQYYKSIRAEFASWELFKKDIYLSKKAREYFIKLHSDFENIIAEKTTFLSEQRWNDLFIFDEGISEESRITLKEKLKKNHFLKLSILLTYDEFNFKYKDLSAGSIRISRLKNYRSSKHYRMSVNSDLGKHFDIHISIDPKLPNPHRIETIHRHIALSSFPLSTPAMAKFGYMMASEKIFSTRYISQLSAWDKIRSMAEIQKIDYIDDKNFWRKTFIRSISVFYKAWNNSGREILPGFVSPENVVVPEIDFSDNVKILSLSTLKKTHTIIDLITAIHANFYQKTIAHYPSLTKNIKINWLFHALLEAVGKNEAFVLLNEFILKIEKKKKPSEHEIFLSLEAKKYMEISKNQHYLPLALFNAVDKYRDWDKLNPDSSVIAKIHTIEELFELYKLNRYTEIVRYKFYRETYFHNSNKKVKFNFDKVILRMLEEPESLAVQFTELSDLQAELTTEEEKNIFNKLVFPDIKEKRLIDLKKIGEKKKEHLVVYSKILDKKNMQYTMREPIDASEVGEVYKLFFKENYPKEISRMDKHYIVVNAHEQVIAGLCYKELEDKIVLIDGLAVTSALQGLGLGSQIMSDFFSRMKSKGFKLVKAHFLFGNYYLKHNFVIDKKWGALVKEL